MIIRQTDRNNPILLRHERVGRLRPAKRQGQDRAPNADLGGTVPLLQMANRLGHPDQAVRSGTFPDDRGQPNLEKPEQEIVTNSKQRHRQITLLLWDGRRGKRRLIRDVYGRWSISHS